MDALSASTGSLGALRASAARDPKTAVKEAARQFEALFMNELMKSMRASVGPGAFDNGASEMGQQMLDAQYATKLSGLPGGLADMIARQLERQIGGPLAASSAGKATAVTLKPEAPPRIPQRAYAEAFVRQHGAAAEAASRETGIPAAFILAQAAHETGWGRKQILNADGTPSHNMFGIKAGGSWQGPTTEITTTEYIDGRARKLKDGFRSYASVEASFLDWARLIKNSPRYAAVARGGADAQAFAQGLQRAGYATDPAYGDKLERMINTTLQLQRAVG